MLNGNGLHDHQQEALERLRGAVRRGKKRVMLQAPTGWGKTKLAAAVVNGALSKGKRVVFTVPTLTLIDQTVQMFYAEGITDVGVIQANHIMTDWSKPVQVASIQTLMRRKLPDATVAVIDEAHKWFEFYGKWMADEAWKDVPFIGLTATPWTKGLGKFYDELIIASTTEELIKEGYLSDFKVYAPSHPDLKGVRTLAGDYHEGDLAGAMNKVPLVADVVDTWLKRGENRQTLCFGVDCAHAKSLQQKFEAAGVATGYIDAYTESAERQQIKDKFHDGELRVVCNVGCLTTGVDWDVRCISLVRPTKSEILFVQIIGRGLRTAEGKDHLLVLDHSDTHLRLGFVTDIIHEHLDGGTERTKVKARAPLPKECPRCAFLRPPRVSACPNCGYAPAPPVSKIRNGQGELEVLERRNGHKVSFAERAAFYAQLRAYGYAHRYKDGWAANKYREKYGMWPRGMGDYEPTEVSPEVASWIRSRAIKWAMGKGRNGG